MKRLALLLMSMVGACAVAAPERGVGNRSLTEMLDGRETVIVAVTEMDFDGSEMDRATFMRRSARVEAELEQQSGFLGYTKRLELLGSKAWTLTYWEDKQSLALFMYAGEHRRAIEASRGKRMNARFANFAYDARRGPLKWSEALEKLDALEDTAAARGYANPRSDAP